ncbi:cytochrome c, class III family protein [Candidatus Magnetomorum sp. HK-1]|nr:cytochrome c, class III family protein [Candidatus Magnetomorum sp. HK-1]
MKPSKFLIGTLTAIMSLCFAFVLYAGTKFNEVIPLNEPSYKHKKPIVQFTHKKHVADYKAGCGDCHHDKAGKPLKLKHGDNVDKCVKCHSKPGEIKGKNAKGMKSADKRAYHANALHDKCRGCHKDYNKKNNTKKAPTSCNKCHKK